MIDPMTNKLNQALYQERLQEAAEARQWRATSVADSGTLAHVRQAIGRQLIALGQRMEAPRPQRHAMR